MLRFFTIAACVLMSNMALGASEHIASSDSANTNKAYQVSRFRSDTIQVPVIATPTQLNNNYPGSFMKGRLTAIQKDVPLDYNEFVQSYIDNYTSPNRRDEMGRIIGLAKYYFPIYEKAFADAGIPKEIEFLSIVESALNPNATSRVGAAGLWQFMSTTGRTYGLNINNYVDERRDPVQASYAAAAYLKDAYQEFGDWLLAIAAYNCGKGSVERAIEKANATDYWSIRPYLPVETRGYVPAYIAVAYVMNYFDQHKITPQTCTLPMQTDTVMVNKFVSLDNISRVINVDLAQLSILNPSYLRLVVNGTPAVPRRLIIPQIAKEKYSALYDALNGTTLTVAAQPVVNTIDPDAGPAQRMPSYHTVKKGETLAGIADRFGVEVSDLKVWNHITGNRATPGQVLKVSAPENVTAARTAIAAGM
ncbi:lytic transglycosylase domain-containing protein [Mucilaginibacter sp. KACC 22063]|uniref:lytic transglycosylase domain-containing protein n=1 Tax=Mucilaginibacter sp. KACC 22063 TaxID=3025666 RepID=UPI00236726E5|nr:lytic transglycosylase domain-containing protein [Mucilaginibacter sp. KACC 22063]WDF55938.1 transglycosylase SLT domain-containing protein [Mucilaginibacter sp. KACC 22063]